MSKSVDELVSEFLSNPIDAKKSLNALTMDILIRSVCLPNRNYFITLVGILHNCLKRSDDVSNDLLFGLGVGYFFLEMDSKAYEIFQLIDKITLTPLLLDDLAYWSLVVSPKSIAIDCKAIMIQSFTDLANFNTIDKHIKSMCYFMMSFYTSDPHLSVNYCLKSLEIHPQNIKAMTMLRCFYQHELFNPKKAAELMINFNNAFNHPCDIQVEKVIKVRIAQEYVKYILNSEYQLVTELRKRLLTREKVAATDIRLTEFDRRTKRFDKQIKGLGFDLSDPHFANANNRLLQKVCVVETDGDILHFALLSVL